MNTTTRRNLRPPEIARRYGVNIRKVLAWIRTGELVALDLSSRTSSRPRYSVTPEALEAFEKSRRVVPDGGESTTQRLRRRARTNGVKEFV